MYDWDAEIERVADKTERQVQAIWIRSGGIESPSVINKDNSGDGSPLFGLLGTDSTCGCPSMIKFRNYKSDIPSLTEELKQDKILPDNLFEGWDALDREARKIILAQFKYYQVKHRALVGS